MRKVHSVPDKWPQDAPVSFGEFVSTQENVVENERLVSRVVHQELDPQTRFNGMKVTDFCLENVIAAGAVGSLVDTQYIGLDGKDVSNVLERANSFMDSLKLKESPTHAPVVEPLPSSE